MKKILILSTFLLALGLASMTSCEYDVVKPASGDVPDTVSFSADIMPIFNASCNMSGCHAAGNTPPDLSPANAYQALVSGNFINVADPVTSSLYTSMASGSMKPFSKPSETALILAWIQQGALNN